MVSSFLRASPKRFRTQAIIWFFAVGFHYASTSSELPPQWIAWNIGQGSFISHIDHTKCIHFDSGGDKPLPSAVVSMCQNKSNEIYISHSDWDHISYLKTLKNKFYRFCRVGPTDSRKASVYGVLPLCPSPRVWSWFPPLAESKHANDLSGVFYYKKLLYPGDSPKKNESQWEDQIPDRPRVLVLSHHGSRTGTSSKLLSHFPSLRMAVASARHSKYGHPHPEVVDRLRGEGLPLLKTESWGHIHFID